MLAPRKTLWGSPEVVVKAACEMLQLGPEDVVTGSVFQPAHVRREFPFAIGAPPRKAFPPNNRSTTLVAGTGGFWWRLRKRGRGAWASKQCPGKPRVFGVFE